MSDDNIPAFEDALRLTIAFYCILEPEKRELVKALVEKYADRARLDEAVAELPSDKPESKPSGLRPVELLARQREYARHLAGMQFSVLESAIEQTGGRCAEPESES